MCINILPFSAILIVILYKKDSVDPQHGHNIASQSLWIIQRDYEMKCHNYPSLFSTSFKSTNVKLRWDDVHLTFIWHSPDHLIFPRPLPDHYLTFTLQLKFLWTSPDIHLVFPWHLPDLLTIIWPSPDSYQTLREAFKKIKTKKVKFF